MFGPDENKMQGNSDWLQTYELALEDVVSCDTINCSRPATHYAQVKCCDAVIIGCKPCLQEAYKVVLFMLKEGKSIICQGCGKTNRPEGWLSRPLELSLV